MKTIHPDQSTIDRIIEQLARENAETPQIYTNDTLPTRKYNFSSSRLGPYANYSSAEREAKIKVHLQEVFTLIGFDLKDSSMQKTPERVAKMFMQETFSGLDYANFPNLALDQNKMGYDDLICVSDIPFYSTCEHHLQAIMGTVTIVYRPIHYILGLSKFNRVVKFFADRPQIQERFTIQLRIAFQEILRTPEVGIYVQASHNCIRCRGVRAEQSITKTYSSNLGHEDLIKFNKLIK